jgi:thioredoxin-like negative regulator of GroEL
MTTVTGKTVRPLAPRLYRWGTVGAVVTVFALGGFFGWRRFQDRAECKKALQLAEQNKFAEAQPLLLRLHERYPNKVEVIRALALGYLRTSQTNQAEPFLHRWCQLQPQEIEPYRQRLNVWVGQQKVAPAIADAQHILQLKPNDLSARLSLVTLLMAEGRYDEAVVCPATSSTAIMATAPSPTSRSG